MTLAVRGAEQGCEIVLIAVGYPLSQHQRRDVPVYLEPGDRVEVLASGLERRRLSRVVDRAIGRAPGR